MINCDSIILFFIKNVFDAIRRRKHIEEVKWMLPSFFKHKLYKRETP